MIDVTYEVYGEETKTYFHEGHKERKLDYIFVDRSTVFAKEIIPEVDKRSVKGKISDHAIVADCLAVVLFGDGKEVGMDTLEVLTLLLVVFAALTYIDNKHNRSTRCLFL